LRDVSVWLQVHVPNIYEASTKAGTTMRQPSVTFVTAKLNKDGFSMARHKDENEKN
jgi:hypothetical protein